MQPPTKKLRVQEDAAAAVGGAIAEEVPPTADTPAAFLKVFADQNAEATVSGLCGRFIRGVNEEQLSMLSDEPGKKLSWVCNDELLQSLLGKRPVAAMVHLGFGLDWIRARLHDGTTHRLVVFRSGVETDTTLATWHNLLSLVRECYGAEMADRLEPQMAALKSTPYEEIDPSGTLREISNLPVEQKFQHSEYFVAKRFLTEQIPVSLYAARAFFYHAVGCNAQFLGTGCNLDGQAEHMTPNKLLVNIPGAK